MKDWGRLITAMVTPFDQNLEVDWKTTRKLVRWLIENDSDGVVVAGTTGESPTLSKEEKLELFQVVKEEAGDKLVVIAGTGSNSTRDSIALSKEAEKTGVDGIMLVTPYYNKPPQQGLYQHFKAVAEETSLPIILYNVPSRTARNIDADTVIRLAEVPNIVAIKEASSDFNQIGRIVKETPEDFLVYSGNDIDTLPILALGGVGVVSVASPLVGKEIKEMIQAFADNDLLKARDIHFRLMSIFNNLFLTTNPIPVKAAMKMAGLDVGPPRPPLVEATEKEKEVLRQTLAELALV
ncbi:4-hydroxy-tetrahydrodipicolinate synthase [Candidatus Hakubella thermalkaliphila]|uniref:4-hydroxy-tetrahydrodipicolinate synthase n=1 Tax=Candidatus Hakubella thermalkaliphila TaxID=2754717 RepID=A0A6V8Q592_9ACTN|nr:4-hydroxy-tetrahydrodipicolinate synthase [Candidatus Hakubella thermalkaliphila]MBT9170429.1 4-hydroxy-tetrahydrodipicolinate synthase [Actinomycetota bacterium]GFP29855.1 4-hydroxy-tetrahydrodipicolinate synthase [Candidatus Hakubella thermalkaliphila]GFP36758.1 4-hydroxy-tetrahydrodipicolinate synthase [Candidatus Hakubella thermalkaliphila]GFP39942.1 4-hydroxy-tetrahydrodipicolinate synthase [Candidatus Hakubella thermalkaliphila]GFP43949.1 4-hydroxy-tetrahydrodipicolinate synthase [Can